MSQSKLLRNLGLLLLAYLGIAAAVGGYFVLEGRFTKKTDPFNPELVALGGAIYKQHCAECHGANLEGEPGWEKQNADGTFPAPPQDHTGHTPGHSDRQLFEFIQKGGAYFAPTSWTSNMPAYEKKLADREIWAVLAFIKSRWPAEVRKKQAAANFAGSFGHH